MAPWLKCLLIKQENSEFVCLIPMWKLDRAVHTCNSSTGRWGVVGGRDKYIPDIDLLGMREVFHLQC